jgi:hypothetical protein
MNNRDGAPTDFLRARGSRNIVYESPFVYSLFWPTYALAGLISLMQVLPLFNVLPVNIRAHSSVLCESSSADGGSKEVKRYTLYVGGYTLEVKGYTLEVKGYSLSVLVAVLVIRFLSDLRPPTPDLRLPQPNSRREWAT